MLWKGANLAFGSVCFHDTKPFSAVWQKLVKDEIQQSWWRQVTVAEAIQVLRIVVNLRFALTGVGRSCESEKDLRLPS